MSSVAACRLRVVISLIEIKLQGLRALGMVNPEIQVVGKMADVISARNRVEVQHVGISGWPAHAELG
jgi:hypothetical protein